MADSVNTGGIKGLPIIAKLGFDLNAKQARPNISTNKSLLTPRHINT